MFEEHHSGPSAGHPRFLKTYRRLSGSLYWNGMKKDIREMVVNCQVCQQQKYETLAPTGLMQSLPIPSRIWTDISMDFIVGLPSCRGKTVIWVIVDRLSKYAHFLALSHPLTTASIANLFVEHIFKLHRMHASIICDRDPLFMNAFGKYK